MARPGSDSTCTKVYAILGMIFVASLLISNVAAQKLFVFGSFTFTCGIILFPVTYIFGDVLTEVYGYGGARLVIWTGLVCNILMVIVFGASIALPAAPGWPFQDAFAQTLEMVPRVVAGSLLAYLFGEFVNSYVMSRIKILTNGKHLWLRTISSTIAGQAIDTIIFAFISFYGVLSNEVILRAVISGYIFKVLYEVIATPITYIVVGAIKRYDGFDKYDTKTNYNPFRID